MTAWLTPKYSAVIEALFALEQATHKVVRIEDVAAWSGRSVNRHLRKHISMAEADGYLTRFRYYTDKNALAVAYQLHTSQGQQPLPFEGRPDQEPF